MDLVSQWAMIIKLALFKQNLKLETDAKRTQGLDVCSVMDGVNFDTHSGYAPNSAYPCKEKRKAPSCLVDSDHQKRKIDVFSAENLDKKGRRTGAEAGPSRH
mgnify:CR=1 FL=1